MNNAQYGKNQKVIITPVQEQMTSIETGMQKYAGKICQVLDYYWVEIGRGDVFYVYTVQVEEDKKEIVLHEDELKTLIE